MSVSDETLRDILQAAEGTLPPPQRVPFEPADDALFAGINGARLGVPEFAIAPGLIIRETFAHVFGPYMMSFGKPGNPNAPHPGPWRAVSGGIGFDIGIELQLDASEQPTGFDRLNTLWWTLALLRLYSAAPLRMHVIANMPFRAAQDSATEPVFLTAEPFGKRLGATINPPSALDASHLEWVKASLVSGDSLMKVEHFNRSFRAFDFAFWAHDISSATIMVWAALQTLYRPSGSRDVGKALSSAIATALKPAGAERESYQQRLATLYAQRGEGVHDSQRLGLRTFLESVEAARLSFICCIDAGAVPDCDALVAQWKAEVGHAGRQTPAGPV